MIAANVTLSQLHAFERVARLGSFRAAAEEIGLTQPSISHRIRELEDALQVSLFTRRGRSVGLTAEGYALVDYADRVLTATGDMVERFHTRDPLKGTLRLGLNESFALVCLPDLLRRLEQRYPAIRTSVFVGDTSAISTKLNAQEVDIAIVSEPNVTKNVKQEALGSNEFGWLASSDVALPRRSLRPADLEQRHLIIPPPPARLHDTVNRWFAHAGVKPKRVSTCNSIPATILTAMNGVAIALLPLRVVEEELSRGTLKVVRVCPPVPSHRVSICYQISEFGEGVRVLVDLIRELVTRYHLFI